MPIGALDLLAAKRDQGSTLKVDKGSPHCVRPGTRQSPRGSARVVQSL